MQLGDCSGVVKEPEQEERNKFVRMGEPAKEPVLEGCNECMHGCGGKGACRLEGCKGCMHECQASLG